MSNVWKISQKGNEEFYWSSYFMQGKCGKHKIQGILLKIHQGEKKKLPKKMRQRNGFLQWSMGARFVRIRRRMHTVTVPSTLVTSEDTWQRNTGWHGENTSSNMEKLDQIHQNWQSVKCVKQQSKGKCIILDAIFWRAVKMWKSCNTGNITPNTSARI